MDGPELLRREPAAPLRGLVNAYYGYREETALPHGGAKDREATSS